MVGDLLLYDIAITWNIDLSRKERHLPEINVEALNN